MDKKAIGAVLGALVLIVAAFFFGGYNKVTNDDAQMMIDDAVAASEAQAAQDLADAQAVHDAELAAEQAATQALSDQVAGLNAELDEVKAELAAMQQTAAEQEAEEAELGQCRYVMDGLGIDVAVSDEELSDRELECALFDGDIEWDGDDYEAEEVLALTGLYLGSNYEDFGSDVCLELEAEKVYYSFVVDADLNTSLIDADEMLEFSLLGEDVKLSKWEDCDTITFFKGSKHRVNEGDSLTVEYDGESYTIYFAVITDDSVFVEVGADSDEIDEGNSRMVGGLDIMVDSVLENEAGEPTPDMAIIYVGNDVEITVEDGDEYAKDSPWEWDIGCNEIGLRLVEDYDEPDDEDYPALCAESELCLPNDFLCIKYDGLAEEDYSTYDLDLDEFESEEMVRVQGDFELGINDYDEVWCDSDGDFWAEVSHDAVNLGDTLELKGSDAEAVCVAGTAGTPYIPAVDHEDAYCEGTYQNHQGGTQHDCSDYDSSKWNCEHAGGYWSGHSHYTCIWHDEVLAVPEVPAVPGTVGGVCFVDDGYEVCFNDGLTEVMADGDDISSEDEDFITDYGMIVDVPEDCVDDQDCTIHVPAEMMEGSITVYLP